MAADPPTRLPLSDIAQPIAAGTFRCHASAVALDGRGVLILGPSGSGKSALALALMAHGGALIADDGVLVSDGPALTAPPEALALIEARGIGLLNAALLAGPVRLSLAVHMGLAEPDRLPPARTLLALGQSVPLILGASHPNLCPAILQYLRQGRAT